jgi:hypothetical protein
VIQNANIVFVVPDGAAGADGTDWTTPPPATGISAVCNFWWDRCAGFGGPGVTGEDGRSGLPGGNGPRGQIVEWVADEFGPNVRIQARSGAGGPGGKGGRGQDGGQGGTGGDGALCEDGGPGGDGGAGGNGGSGGRGGRGGDGGEITVRTRVYNSAGCELDTSGSLGGSGGHGGARGEGGPIGPQGPPAPVPHVSFCGTIVQLGGMPGQPGRDGAPGQPGAGRGPNRVIIVP